jgi:cysteine desulfurase
VLHTDAVQAVAWIDVATATRDADLVSISAHKFGGPTGVGALVVRRRTHLQPIVEGGGQERGLRSGTANVAGIVGMAAALAATAAHRAEDVARIGALRDRLAAGLLAAVPEATVTGDRSVAVAGNCHITFPKVEAESLLLLLDRDGVYAAAGSACQSGSLDPSHVLLAMGMSKDRALSSIRLTLGWQSTDADVDRALAVIPAAVKRLRGRARR